MMKQRKYVRGVRRSREEIRKIRILREIENKRARALRPVDVMDHNIPSSFHKASEVEIAIIRARKIPRPRAWIDSFVDKKANS
jgi:hypothetical protein